MEVRVDISPEDIAQGESLDFEDSKEYWNVYKLSDGTTFKVKLVLTGVKRLKKYKSDGESIYLISCQNAMRVAEIPKNLIVKPKQDQTKTIV